MAKSNTAEAVAEAVPATRVISIQGIDFEAPAPYAEGHPLTANEAVALNGLFGENLRNNFSAKVKAAQKAATEAGSEVDVAALRNEFVAYSVGYEFNGKRQSAHTPADPVAKEAVKIAKSLILAALRKKGIDPKTLEEGKLDELVSGILTNKPEITEEARRRIAATQEVASDALAGLI